MSETNRNKAIAMIVTGRCITSSHVAEVCGAEILEKLVNDGYVKVDFFGFVTCEEIAIDAFNGTEKHPRVKRAAKPKSSAPPVAPTAPLQILRPPVPHSDGSTAKILEWAQSHSERFTIVAAAQFTNGKTNDASRALKALVRRGLLDSSRIMTVRESLRQGQQEREAAKADLLLECMLKNGGIMDGREFTKLAKGNTAKFGNAIKVLGNRVRKIRKPLPSQGWCYEYRLVERGVN